MYSVNRYTMIGMTTLALMIEQYSKYSPGDRCRVSIDSTNTRKTSSHMKHTIATMHAIDRTSMKTPPTPRVTHHPVAMQIKPVKFGGRNAGGRSLLIITIIIT
jgi:hypothetical protein